MYVTVQELNWEKAISLGSTILFYLTCKNQCEVQLLKFRYIRQFNDNAKIFLELFSVSAETLQIQGLKNNDFESNLI